MGARAVTYPQYGNAHPAEVQARYLALAFEIVPDEVIRWLGLWLTRQGRRESPMVDRKVWAELPAEVVSSILMARLRDEATNPWLVGYFLDELLSRDDAEARLFAKQTANQRLPSEDEQRERILAAARSLLLHSSDAGWSVLWVRFEAEPAFGVELIKRAAGMITRIGMAPFLDRIAEVEVADLYLWCERHIPHSLRPEGMHSYETNDFVEDFREGILRNLQHRGTVRSLAGD